MIKKLYKAVPGVAVALCAMLLAGAAIKWK